MQCPTLFSPRVAPIYAKTPEEESVSRFQRSFRHGREAPGGFWLLTPRLQCAIRRRQLRPAPNVQFLEASGISWPLLQSSLAKAPSQAGEPD